MATDSSSGPESPRLAGVDHVAFPTWKPVETVGFYRDVMGLKLIHAISAKGWGRTDHPDFLHFFFDTGQGSTIAFFYYVGTSPREDMAGPRGYLGMARHLAWSARSEEDLLAWRRRLEARGIAVSEVVEHEALKSIYFRDPNGYPLEITWKARALTAADAEDAALTIAAMIETFGGGSDGRSIEDMWRRKGEKLRAQAAAAK